MSGNELIDAWLNVTDRVPIAHCIPIAFQDLPARVRGDSTMWAERFLSQGANPHTGHVPVTFAFHLATVNTPDLLRYEYPVPPYELEAVESINFTLLMIRQRPELLDIGPTARLSAIQSAIDTVLNVKDTDHQWTFQFPAALVEGARFSTNPGVDPLFLPSWTSRADGGIRHSLLYLLCYKKFFDRANFRDIKDWFDDAFRRRHP